MKFGPKPKLMHENQLISQKSYSVDIGGKKKKTGLLLLDRSPGGLRTSRNTAAEKNANTTKKQKKKKSIISHILFPDLMDPKQLETIRLTQPEEEGLA